MSTGQAPRTTGPQARVPAGVSDGGQFAARPRAEAPVTLTNQRRVVVVPESALTPARAAILRQQAADRAAGVVPTSVPGAR